MDTIERDRTENASAGTHATQAAVPGSEAAAETKPAPPAPGATEADAVPAAAKEKSDNAGAGLITIDDFIKVELRVAQVLTAERVPKADKLLRLTVDVGEQSPRQILAGIAMHYEPESLLGRKIIVVSNLQPRKLRGLESQGMLLAASAGDEGKPVLATFAEDVPNGTRLKRRREVSVSPLPHSPPDFCACSIFMSLILTHIAGRSSRKTARGCGARARGGVCAILNVGTGDPHAGNLERAVETAERYEGVYAAVGVHPHDARLFDDAAEELLLRLVGGSAKVVAWGEIGLDFHYDHSPRATQREVFAGNCDSRRARDARRPTLARGDEETGLLQEEWRGPDSRASCTASAADGRWRSGRWNSGS